MAGIISKWDQYSQFGLDLAATASSLGFSAAKSGTKFGFSIARGIASTAVGLTGSVVDYTLFGGTIGVGPLAGDVVSKAVSAIEAITLAPILLGETITSTSLTAAQSSLSVLRSLFSGSDEAGFSLASFVSLVRREWQNPPGVDGLPEERYGVGAVMKGLVGWAALQGVTSQWHEQGWFMAVKEIYINEREDVPGTRLRPQPSKSRIHVTGDVIHPNRSSQVITADIGEALPSGTIPHRKHPDTTSRSLADLEYSLLRYSKLVLGGYGGAGLFFFGVPPIPPPRALSSRDQMNQEEADLAGAVDAYENENSAPTSPGELLPPPSYSWWNLLLGRHDEDIFLHYANVEHLPSGKSRAAVVRPATALRGTSDLMPRFWILTDHVRQEIVLVIRGTMSLNEVAVDLTCDPADFELRTVPPAQTQSSDSEDVGEEVPGSFPIDLSTPPHGSDQKRTRVRSDVSSAEDSGTYQVHGGMLKMALAMGGKGKPVYTAVREALRRNHDYSLVICGHSLGAGVGALLALMWANPSTRLTHRSSGLPLNRPVSAYCYGPPCLVSAKLSRLAAQSNLITSFVHSNDFVSRLSLGSVRDLTRAATWLCEVEKEGRGEGYGGVTSRALKYHAGFGKYGDQDWFLSIRKTLEANMHMAHLYPPGRVLWAVHDEHLHPTNRRFAEEIAGDQGNSHLRLFEVMDVEKAFGQIIFARDMLSSHGPHQYDRVIHELFMR